jgi:hypothetical protein
MSYIKVVVVYLYMEVWSPWFHFLASNAIPHIWIKFLSYDKDGSFDFGIIGASCDGTFGKVEVHVCPSILKDNNLFVVVGSGCHWRVVLGCECMLLWWMCFRMWLNGSLAIYFLAILVVVQEKMNRYGLKMLPGMVALLMCIGGWC